MNSEFYNKNLLQRASNDADQAEFVALKNGQATAISGLQDDIIADSMDDFSVESEELKSADWQVYQNKIDSGTEKILEEIIHRKNILGALYPFEISDNYIEYRPVDNKLYEFLLCSTISQNLSKGNFTRIPRYFERVSAQISASYLGSNTDYRHIGWPRSNPTRFKAAMEKVREDSGEWDWHPLVGLPNDGPRHGDEGVDYIIWKNFGCGRPIGNLFLLGQCACGNDWNDKFKDIGERFTKWFGGGSLVKPVHVLSVPHVLVLPWIREASREAGLIFDRIRMVKAAELGGHYQHHAWENKFSEIIEMATS